MIKLIIKLSQEEIELKLLKDRVPIDLITAKYYHNLSDMLISSLDKLLKRNMLDPEAVKSYKILGNLGADSTSYKIAAAFVEGLKI